jgi:hypothetical protein
MWKVLRSRKSELEKLFGAADTNVDDGLLDRKELFVLFKAILPTEPITPPQIRCIFACM